MASGHFATPQIYPTIPEIHMPPTSFPTSARINENHTIVVPVVSRRNTNIVIRLGTFLSIFINLVFLTLITAMLIFFMLNDIPETIRNISTSESGLDRVDHKTNTHVDLSSVMCIMCQAIPFHLLWQEKFVKVLSGNSAICCRKIERSFVLLSKEVSTFTIVKLCLS
jgi:large-conductance mechanosensitive channel